MPLRQLYPDAQSNAVSDRAQVDIIAVHGLNPRSKNDSDHAWDTWRTPSSPQGRLWLRDDLPESFPNSRIFLYEYNSTAVYGKDRSTFVDNANAFLEAIRIKRRGSEQRPILLLGHSLGGLLIKQALINAHNNEKYAQIKTATKGLGFFATPHDGGNARLVSIGAVAANIAVGLGFQKGDGIVETLDAGSMFSDLMQEHWKHRLLEYDIVSFWGTLDRIVPKESSSFGLPGKHENVVALQADHRSVCKFGESQADQDNLDLVRGNIEDLFENAVKISATDEPEASLKERTRKLFRNLNTLPYKDRKDRNPERVEGTCEWFTSHRLFQIWRESTKSSFLWVSADLGCGKSVLAKYLIDQVLPTTSIRTTCYFFFKDDFEDQRTPVSALRCVLAQLFRQRPDLLSKQIIDEFDGNDHDVFASFSDLWDIFISVTSSKEAGEVVCVLDALDECEDRGRSQLAKVLCQLYATERREGMVKFLLTSRPYASIQQDFQVLERKRPTIHLSGEDDIEVDKIALEINILIDYKVRDLGTIHRLSQEEQRVLRENLTRVPHRTYLWVYLTLDVISTSIGQKMVNLQDIVHQIPRTVEDAYEKILGKSRDVGQARRLLHVVLAATRPLTLQEMAVALSVREHYRSINDIHLESEDRFRRAIRNLCGLFVTITDSKIYLLHQTARKFLVRQDEETPSSILTRSPQWQRSFCSTESDHVLAEICSWYLSLDDFEVKRGKEDYIFLDYSSKNWADHFRKASSRCNEKLVSVARRLCNTNSQLCLNWFEIYWTTTKHYFPNGVTELIIASYFGLHRLVSSMLGEKNTNLSLRDTVLQRSALSWACENGHVRIVELILAKVTKVTKVQDAFRNRILGKRKAPIVDSKDRDQQTPLIHAAAQGNEDIVQMLLDKGAVIEASDIDGYTALIMAALCGNESVVRMLLDKGAAIEASDIDGRTGLILAVRAGDESVVRILLDRGAAIEARDNEGYTGLMKAALFGDESVVRILLDNGAAIEARDNYGSTVLMTAVRAGNESVVRIILDRGVAIEARDNYGFTALMIATSWGKASVIRMLLERGADINVKDKDGDTALLVAAYKDHQDVVQLLLDKGADAKIENKFGKTIFELAERNADILKLLENAQRK